MPRADFQHPQWQAVICQPLNCSAQDFNQPIIQFRLGKMRASVPVINMWRVIRFLNIHVYSGPPLACRTAPQRLRALGVALEQA